MSDRRPGRARAALARSTPASRGIGRDEQRHRRRAERRGEVHEAGVDADDELGAREERGERGQRLPRRHARGRLAGGEALAARALRRAAPRQQDGEARARERADQRAPVRFRPQLVGAARRVQEDHVRTVAASRRGRRRARRVRSAADRRARSRAPRRRAAGSGRSGAGPGRSRDGRRARASRPARGCWRGRARAACRARVRAIERALHLLLQVEHGRVLVAPEVARGTPPSRARSPRRAGVRASGAARRESRGARRDRARPAARRPPRRPSRRRARGVPRTSATSASAWTMSPSDEGRTTRTAVTGRLRRTGWRGQRSGENP